MELSIIIPAKGEAANISRCLERVIAAYPGAEIIVVDAGIDETQSIVQKFQSGQPNLHYVLNRPDKGKGDAIRKGILKATGSVMAQIDADLQFLPEDLHRLLTPLQNDQADMTLGSRFMKDSCRQKGSVPGARSFGNRMIAFWMSILVGQRITDALAGMKAWKREVTESFPLLSNTYSYEVELFVKAIQKGWRVMDVPVTTEARQMGKSTVPVMKTTFQLLRDSLVFQFSAKGSL